MHGNANEPPHLKTNKMTVRPAKTQISLGIRPVWSKSSLADSIRCPGWSESSLAAHAILLVLSWGGSIIVRHKSQNKLSEPMQVPLLKKKKMDSFVSQDEVDATNSEKG